MSAKKKPAKRTVTAWVFMTQHPRGHSEVYGYSRKVLTEQHRRELKDLLEDVGPIIRIEVPLE
jgi:hypothetical protein